ncbi:MAG: aspartyl-tRNA(Asn)/glutamyl-tRNA(Gln) amidotransferase subunit [Acetobacteraceae bacterium]|nr:aspartyl-tRNA(Asn)/glutamyl-tRNA(Gln) amidotransferase subunit [Acetobacteraceae bacterium]
MSNEDLCRLSATEAARLIAGRKLSPVELTDAVLERAERLQPTLNLFALLTADDARRDARAAEAAVMGGGLLGPLHGVPITVKDNLALAGKPLRQGSLMTEGVVPANDAAVVARVKEAGAVIIGKTTLPEFAHKVLTDSLLHGVTRNPWNPAHTPGGSSGGASAALAAGVAPLAIGTDGGGSLRCPASCTGVIGFKTTLGRVPNDSTPDGFANYSFTGPMARNAADTALLLSVMAGPLAVDPYSLAAPPLTVRVPKATAAGVRIGWIEHFGRYRTDPDVGRVTGAAIAVLAEQGAVVETLTDPCFDDIFDVYTVIASTAHAARLGVQAERFGTAVTESLRASIARGASYSSVEWQRAHDKRTSLFRAVQRLFTRFDVIATPTMTAAPPLVNAGGSIATDMYAEWASALYPFNLTGHPAISVPAGFSEHNLPVGLQLIGPWFGEGSLLDLASCLEAERPQMWP